MSLALKGKKKENTGKGFNRQLRSAGVLPAVMYGRDFNIPLTLNPKDLDKIIQKEGINALIDLSVEGDSEKNRKVILKELQTHPLKEGYVHVDFIEVDMNKPIKVAIPITLVGQSPGEKMGGIVNQVTRDLDIKCLPGNIPTEIEVPMGEVELGQVLHVSDLSVPENVEVLNQPGDTVVTVFEEKIVEEVVPEEEAVAVEGEVAEGEAAPAEGEESPKPEGKKE